MRLYRLWIFFILYTPGFSQQIEVRLVEKSDTLPVSRMMTYIMDPIDSSFLGFTDRDSVGIYSFELTHQPKGNSLMLLAFGHGYKPLTISIHDYNLEHNIRVECERDEIYVGNVYLDANRTVYFEPNIFFAKITGDYANRYFDTLVFYQNKREQEMVDSIFSVYSGSYTLIWMSLASKPFTIPWLGSVDVIGGMEYFFDFFKEDVLFQHFFKINGIITLRFTAPAEASSIILALEFLDSRGVKIETLTSLSDSIINRRIPWIMPNVGRKAVSSLPMEFKLEIIYLRQ